jgi:hypothetical protein
MMTDLYAFCAPVLLQVLSALMAAAWSNLPHSTLSSSKLASLLFSSAQLAAAPPAAVLEAAADAAVLAALGSSAEAEQQPKQQQNSKFSAAEVVRVLWSLAVLNALDIARLGWLLVALGWLGMAEAAAGAAAGGQASKGGEKAHLQGAFVDNWLWRTMRLILDGTVMWPVLQLLVIKQVQVGGSASVCLLLAVMPSCCVVDMVLFET